MGRSASDVMRAMVAMFATGDVSDAEAVVHPGYLDHQGLGGKPVHGPPGFAAVVEAARRSCERLEVTVEDLLTETDRAAARLRWEHAGAEGEVVWRETIEIIRIEDGMAVEHWGGRS